MTFTVATYNVLATAYIKKEWYPLTPDDLLRPERRLPAVARHALDLDADILCLQEVEDAMFAQLATVLSPAGYHGELSKKRHDKPDGCATFVRTATIQLLRLAPLWFTDGGNEQPDSGHLAQLVVLQADGRTLGIANTHLKWDPPLTPRSRQIGFRQLAEMLTARAIVAPEAGDWILCGDFNATADSEVIAMAREAGFQSAHAATPLAATCNSNRVPKMIDHLLFTAGLDAEPVPLPEITSDTALPGPGQPSDHLALAAHFTWRSGASGPP